MPIMEFHAPYETAFLPCEITAYMLFPKNALQRGAYLAKQMAEYTLKQAQEEECDFISAEVLQNLAESNAVCAPNITEHIVKQACVAAEIFLNLVKLNSSGEDASVNKAIHLGGKYFKEALSLTAGKISSSESSIRRAWSAYMPAAHLWAAYTIISESTENNSESYLQQLSLAHQLVKLAPKFSSKNAKEPLFSSDELWIIPDFVELPECSLMCHGLSEGEQEHLRSYVAPSLSKYDH